MYNSQEELLILHNVGINGKARKCRTITPMIWHFPPRNWIKINIDGAAKGAPGDYGCGGVTTRSIGRSCDRRVNLFFSTFLTL